MAALNKRIDLSVVLLLSVTIEALGIDLQHGIDVYAVASRLKSRKINILLQILGKGAKTVYVHVTKLTKHKETQLPYIEKVPLCNSDHKEPETQRIPRELFPFGDDAPRISHVLEVNPHTSHLEEFEI
jgi:hypothetical protein